MNAPVIGWHFTGPFLRDGRPIPAIGEWLVHEGPVEICESGLHASRHPRDALVYAPGPFLHKVECKDVVHEHGDKLVCRRRRILATIDATDLLRRFARKRALSVIHLWDAPAVVREFLETGDEEVRAAAWAAARAAARAASRGERAATSAAASANASATAWDAARTASAAASTAAWAAAAVWAAALARAVAIAQERAEFLAMVEEAFAEENA